MYRVLFFPLHRKELEFIRKTFQNTQSIGKNQHLSLDWNFFLILHVGNCAGTTKVYGTLKAHFFHLNRISISLEKHSNLSVLEIRVRDSYTSELALRSVDDFFSAIASLAWFFSILIKQFLFGKKLHWIKWRTDYRWVIACLAVLSLRRFFDIYISRYKGFAGFFDNHAWACRCVLHFFSNYF